jgi:RNA polymerase sigma factor for flagellar operon FliA
MDNLIEMHIGYAHAIAAEMLKKYPASVDRRDIESAAELGLVQAARAYDSSRGIAFTTFAYYRIRGAIYDELRQIHRASKFEEAANEYMADYTSAPTPSSASKPFPEEVREISADIATTYLLSLQSRPQAPVAPMNLSPVDQLLWNEQRDQVRSALQGLPEKQRKVVESYYFCDLTFEEIGKQLGLSKSWVSRVHARGLQMMRRILQRSGSGPEGGRVWAGARTSGGKPQQLFGLETR